MLRIFGVVLVFTFVNNGFAKITIEKFEACEPNADYVVSVTQKIKEEGGMQVLEEGIMNSKISLDDNITGSVEVFAFDDGEWNSMIKLHDKFCQVITKYMTDIAKELEKAAGLTSGCPYPAGEYKITNLPLDFEKIDYSLAPRGKLRVKMTLADTETEKILNCLITEFSVTD